MVYRPAADSTVHADAAIRQAALDYWESWGEGDPVRAERALPRQARRVNPGDPDAVADG